MKSLISTLMILLSYFNYAQNDKQDKMALYNYVVNTPKKWNYFILNDTISVKIINHLQAPGMCGFFATASVTIVETENNELIRILDLCNTSKEFKPNQIIKIFPQKAPPFDVQFAFEYVENKKTKQTEVVSKYDTEVLRTTWGTLDR